MTCLPLRLVALCVVSIMLNPSFVLAQEPPVVATPGPPPPPELAQPAYDVLRIDDGGFGRPYRVWEAWVPQVVTTPDGGAWAFFTAQVRTEDGYGDRRLFAARFDPARMVWLPARSMGSSGSQFGASAAVDSQGAVHLVYSDRQAGSDSWSQLIYQKWVNDSWAEPIPVSPHPDAGHQMLPSLAIDAQDGLHVVWSDQRLVTPDARAALPTNADLMSSDLVDGEWTEPTPVNVREAPDVNPAWPLLIVDGDRLVVVWSTYRGTTPEEMKSAASVEWSTRPLSASHEWSAPETLYVREGGDAGGRLIDLAADPRGGAVVVYGLYNRGNNDLLMQRLDAGQETWTEPVLLSSGDFGYLPNVTISGDGTVFAVFNVGRSRDVDIGGLIADASGKTAGAVTLTPAVGGVTALASISLDKNGTPWVIYMNQPEGSSNVTEIQTVRAATFSPTIPE